MSLRLSGLDRGILGAAQWTLDVAAYYGVPVTVTSVYRSNEKQSQLRRQYERCLEAGPVHPGREPGCRYPANRPGDSAHNFGWAWDSVVDPQFEEWWVAVRRYAGFAVPDHDRIHAEVPGWRNYV